MTTIVGGSMKHHKLSIWQSSRLLETSLLDANEQSPLLKKLLLQKFALSNNAQTGLWRRVES